MSLLRLSVENPWNSRGAAALEPPTRAPLIILGGKTPPFSPALPPAPLSSVEIPRRPKAMPQRDFRTTLPRSPHGGVPYTEMMIF